MIVIDVSKWQGNIDFKKLKENHPEVTGVIIRASYGQTGIDPCFSDNYNKAKEQGLNVGAYHYTYATSIQKMSIEMENFCTQLSGKLFELPVFIDIEYEPVILALTKEERINILSYGLEYLETRGYFTGVYCSEDFMLSNLGYEYFSQYFLWIAKWDSIPPSIPCGLWQYTSKGILHGITENTVDMNIPYTEDVTEIIISNGFNGFDTVHIPDFEVEENFKTLERTPTVEYSTALEEDMLMDMAKMDLLLMDLRNLIKSWISSPDSVCFD